MEEMNKLIVEEVVKKTLSEIVLKTANQRLHFSLTSRTSTSTLPESLSSAVPRVMQASLAARSLSTLMVAGAPTEVVPSQGRIPQKWTGPLLTSADRWQSLQ